VVEVVEVAVEVEVEAVHHPEDQAAAAAAAAVHLVVHHSLQILEDKHLVVLEHLLHTVEVAFTPVELQSLIHLVNVVVDSVLLFSSVLVLEVSSVAHTFTELTPTIIPITGIIAINRRDGMNHTRRNVIVRVINLVGVMTIMGRNIKTVSPIMHPSRNLTM
jgi:hypothetical protein